MITERNRKVLNGWNLFDHFALRRTSRQTCRRRRGWGITQTTSKVNHTCMFLSIMHLGKKRLLVFMMLQLIFGGQETNKEVLQKVYYTRVLSFRIQKCVAIKFIIVWKNKIRLRYFNLLQQCSMLTDFDSVGPLSALSSQSQESPL